MQNKINGFAMIFDIKPVPHVEAFAVDGKGFIVQAVDNHERDQLFREMIGPVVVGTTGDSYREIVGTLISLYKQISSGFGAAVGRAGVDRRLFGEEEIRPVKRQITVDFIGGNLMVTNVTESAAGIHQNGSADNIRLQKNGWVFNTPIYVAFCCEVNDRIRLFLFKESIYPFPVAYVKLHETEVWGIHHRLQCAEVSGIRQFIEAYDAGIRMRFKHIENEVTADESGTAGDNIGH
jgi:hypothetical protein